PAVRSCRGHERTAGPRRRDGRYRARAPAHRGRARVGHLLSLREPASPPAAQGRGGTRVSGQAQVAPVSLRAATGPRGGSSLVRVTVTLGIVLLVWYGLAWFLRFTNDPGASKLPYPHEVIQAYLTYPSTFIEAAWSTASRAVVGFFAGLA